MFDVTPDPILFTLGPLSVGWYGISYAVGLAAAYLVLVRLARLAGEDPDVVGNGIVIVAIAALIGGRAYHVIDQWALYADAPITAILPIEFKPDGGIAFKGFAGLGVYGGIATGVAAAWWYARRLGVPFARWADIVAPSLFVMQAIGRWGNYFNQELYGPPTTLPWGIPIDCAFRIAGAGYDYSCDVLPETTRFHPLFLYESLSGILGALFLVWLGFRLRDRLRAGDLLLIFFIWYGVTRFALEFLRAGNWTFFGVPTAQIVSIAFISVGIVGLILRHRAGAAADDPPPSVPGVATWGAIGPNDWKQRPISEPWADAGDPFDDDDDPFDDAIDAEEDPLDDADADPFDDDDDDGATTGEPVRPPT